MNPPAGVTPERISASLQPAVGRISDTELLRRAARGDRRSYEAFYRRHAPIVHGWFLRRIRAREVAEDLAAETSAAALHGVHRFRGERDEAAASWLYAIAARELGRYLRHRRTGDACRQRLGLCLERHAGDRASSGNDELEAELARALGALPAGQQAVIRLRVLLEQDYEAFADALDCSPATARQRLARALAELRHRLATDRP